MERVKIEGTDRAPEIDFDFDELKFHVRGESYPEDVSAFYGKLTEKLGSSLADTGGKSVEFNFELIYFNSSSAKVIMGIFDQLEEAAEEGADVVINWYYDEEDDTMEELGEEFGEDLEHAKFNMKIIDA